ncbi:MAG TPA: GAF and ANTAR domain-containing protein [Marmoricola sp.]|nr:GAF and ANTAR domain-containing protein [Marmoricola sp.]
MPRTGDQALLLAQSFVTLADTLVDDYDVVELLGRLVTDCVGLLDVDAAGILLINQHRVLELVASSDEASRLMEVFQLESHSGPCVDAVQSGEPVLITSLEELHRRWPAFGAAVEGVGYSSVYAFPMRLRAETIGALNLFRSGTSTLAAFDQRLAQAMADIGTIGILQHRALTRSSDLADQLQLALNTRISIEQAKGVLAEYGGVRMDEAFHAIRAFARENRLKLSDVARSLIDRELDPAHVIARRPPR